MLFWSYYLEIWDLYHIFLTLRRNKSSLKEKDAGNAAYKKKDFDTAIQHYTKALELDDEDISYLTNRAAVYLEMGKVCSIRLC